MTEPLTITHTPRLLPAPMRAQPVADAIHTWMQAVDLATLVELWWMAQAERAAADEEHQRRLDDPADMYGKPPEYVASYYSKLAVP